MDLGNLFEPQEKPPAKVTTLKDILQISLAYEEGHDDFPDCGVETETETELDNEDEEDDEDEEKN